MADPLALFLSKLGSLSDNHVITIGTAVNLHYGATLLFERDISAAYVLLVAGIETLSRTYGSPPDRWEEWDQSQNWNKWMEEQEILDSRRAALIERLMKDKQLRLSETFANYGSTNLRSSFWDIEWQEWVYGINVPEGTWAGPHKLPSRKIGDFVDRDSSLLRKALKNSYAARSGYVHSGSPVDFITSLLWSGNKVKPEAPLPFAILRSILVELIDAKLESLASPYELPDVRITFTDS